MEEKRKKKKGKSTREKKRDHKGKETTGPQKAFTSTSASHEGENQRIHKTKQKEEKKGKRRNNRQAKKKKRQNERNKCPTTVELESNDGYRSGR